MRLETFRARNLGPFGPQGFAVDLRTLAGPLVAVVGPNGAGKSTFLELFGPGAFYRSTPTRGTLVELATARDAVLEVGVVNGQAWTLRHLADAVSGKSEAVVLDANGAAVLPDTKVRSMDAWAAKHLPAPQVLYACMFAPQGASGFLGAKPAERKATLLRVLGVEHYEALAERARERLKEARTAVEVAAQRVADERARTGDVAALEAELEAARGAAATADGAVQKEREELEAGKAERTRITELEREGERRRKRRLELATAITGAEKEESDTAERLTNNRAVLADADAIRKAVADVERLGGDLSTARAAVQQADGDALRGHREGTDLEQRLHAIEVRLERSDELLAGRDAIAAAEASLPGLEAAAEEAAGAVNVTQDTFDDLQGQRAAGAEERIGELRAGIVEARNELPGDASTAARLLDGTLGEDDAAVKLASELPAQTSAAMAALKAARDRKAVADRKLADARGVAARRSGVEAAEQDQAAAVRERAELEPRRDEAFLAKRAAEQRAVGHRSRVAELERALAAAKPVAAKAEPLAKAEARIVELERALDGLRKRLTNLRAELEAAPEAEPVPSDGPMVGLLEGSVQEAEIAARKAHAAVAVAGERLEASRAAGSRLVELETDRAKAEAELADWTRLASDLGRDGLQAAEIDAAGPELTELVNGLLHECHGPRFTVRVETQRASADGKRMLEGCEVVVLDTVRGREAPGETFSGGERVIISEALSLALSMLACRRAGLEGVTLVRDESGAALDPENAGVYVAMLRRAAAVVRADKVLFVSHSPDVIDMADSRVEVG